MRLAGRLKLGYYRFRPPRAKKSATFFCSVLSLLA